MDELLNDLQGVGITIPSEMNQSVSPVTSTPNFLSALSAQ